MSNETNRGDGLLNKRIRELAEQVEFGWDDKYHWYVGNEQMEKFVALVVEECANFIEQDQGSGEVLANRLKQHFVDEIRERDEAWSKETDYHEGLEEGWNAAAVENERLRAEVERLKEEPALLRAALIDLCNVSRVALEDAYGRARNSKLKGEEK